MYFSRIHLRPDADPRGLIGLTGYREHQALWDLFEPDPSASRDFLFRSENPHGLPTYYLISERQPNDRRGIWEIETKDYEPKLHNGQTLAFSLRANPVVTRTDENGKSKRNDLVMDIKTQTAWREQDPSQRPTLNALVQEAGEQWITPRFERCGAQLISVLSDGYQRHHSQKRGQKQAIRYSTLELQGMLAITDAELFLDALYRGIGPAKAFGCGLLLVRRT